MKKYIVATLVILLSCNKDNVDMTPINVTGKILFISRRIANSSDWQMVMMNADGTNQKLVSNSLVLYQTPILSNSKSKIAFTTYDASNYYNLYIIDTSGQNLKLLSRGKFFCGNPAWSQSDDVIVFVKNENSAIGNNDIYSINVNSGNEIKLTNQNNNFSPAFMADNEVVYASSNNNLTGIYKMKLDGSGTQSLTPQNLSFSSPIVSPDKTRIAITSVDWNGSQIFVMNADGTNRKQITFTVSSKYFDTGFARDGNSSPVWSPNNNTIAYVSYENGSPDIFKINANGSGNKRLTDTPLRDEYPCWTTDGNYIIFSSNRNPAISADIYIMRNDGQLQTPLSNYIGDDVLPSFINK